MKHGKDILLFCEFLWHHALKGGKIFKLSGYGEKLAVLRGKCWKVLCLYLCSVISSD